MRDLPATKDAVVLPTSYKAFEMLTIQEVLFR